MDLLSVQQRNDELQITAARSAARLCRDKYCWQEVGKWKDETLHWSETKKHRRCALSRRKHLTYLSEVKTATLQNHYMLFAPQVNKKKNGWNDLHAVGTTTLPIIKGNRLHCWTNWLVIQLWLSNKKGLEAEMVAPVQVKLCIKPTVVKKKKKNVTNKRNLKKKEKPTIIEIHNKGELEGNCSGRIVDYAEKPEKLRRLRILRCRWPHTAHRARPATKPSSDLTTPAVWNY